MFYLFICKMIIVFVFIIYFMFIYIFSLFISNLNSVMDYIYLFFLC